MATTISAGDSGECGGHEGVGAGKGEIMLFGVRVVVDSMRKSVSLNNLSQYVQPHELINKEKESSVGDAGYASAEDAVPRLRGNRSERKRGVPWTEEEHKLFLLGLQKVGKGDWRGISRNFVKTRTPTQVASHAQKYFLRRTNLNRRRRRSSLFDITTDSVPAIPMEDEQSHSQDNKSSILSESNRSLPPPQDNSNFSSFSLMPTISQVTNPGALPIQVNSAQPQWDCQGINVSSNLMCSAPVIPAPQPSVTYNQKLDLNLPVDQSPVLLKLSVSSDQRETSTRRHSAYQAMSSFNNRDSVITVA